MKCLIRIQKYDVAVREPPFKFVTLEENVPFDDVSNASDDYGVARYALLHELCRAKGFVMRFYSMSSCPNHRWDITVNGEYEAENGIF